MRIYNKNRFTRGDHPSFHNCSDSVVFFCYILFNLVCKKKPRKKKVIKQNMKA